MRLPVSSGASAGSISRDDVSGGLVQQAVGWSGELRAQVACRETGSDIPSSVPEKYFYPEFHELACFGHRYCDAGETYLVISRYMAGIFRE
jgi:hypothetical protein